MTNPDILQNWVKPIILVFETKLTSANCEGKLFSNDDAEVGSTCSAS
jgi:hypothetical protein